MDYASPFWGIKDSAGANGTTLLSVEPDFAGKSSVYRSSFLSVIIVFDVGAQIPTGKLAK